VDLHVLVDGDHLDAIFNQSAVGTIASGWTSEVSGNGFAASITGTSASSRDKNSNLPSGPLCLASMDADSGGFAGSRPFTARSLCAKVERTAKAF
jgi:hypothetical protein